MLIAVARRHHRALRECAVLDLRHHALAGIQRGHVRADGRYGPGEVLAGHEGDGRQVLVRAGDDEQIRKIDARGMHVDDHLVRTGLRIGQRLELEVFERAVLVED